MAIYSLFGGGDASAQIQQMITAALNNLKIGEDVKDFILNGNYYAKNINLPGTYDAMIEGHTTSINSLRSSVSTINSSLDTMNNSISSLQSRVSILESFH